MTNKESLTKLAKAIYSYLMDGALHPNIHKEQRAQILHSIRSTLDTLSESDKEFVINDLIKEFSVGYDEEGQQKIRELLTAALNQAHETKQEKSEKEL